MSHPAAKLKSKLLNILLVLSSLVGYLEWGKENSLFLFQAEGEIIYKLFTNPIDVIHPFTILPLGGQIILLYTLFQKEPNKFTTYTGMALIGILLAFMFLIGVMGLRLLIVLSTIPFIATSILTIKHHRNN